MVKRESRSAFTLIEMMVVVAIIGILIASVFKLIGAAGENTKKAQTVARIEKLANALAGYYAEYGTYPPVKKVRSSDPFVEDDGSGENHSSHSGTLTSGNAVAACRAQPVSFEFPNIEDLDDYVNIIYAPSGKISVNQALGAQKWQGEEWSETRIFKFGLLSYLLPRVELMGGLDLAQGQFGRTTPKQNFFESEQWTKNNTGTIEAVRTRENHACARWMPNFKNAIYGGGSLFGVDLAEPDYGWPRFTYTGNGYITGSSARYVLQVMTIRDGWGNSLFYYSPPPYQSYRIWSCGPDGKTFPPWIDMRTLDAGDRKTASSWTADDITRFDR